jgi:holo-[acyl-carrier protein] synthase
VRADEDLTMVIGTGVDLAEIDRIERALAASHGARLRDRVFTAGEQAYCESRGRGRGQSYAARFAAKEAVLKALGTGLARGMRWQDVEVIAAPNRRPLVRLHGAVAAAARAQGVVEVQLSIAHEGDYALAFAVTRPVAAAGPLDEQVDFGLARLDDVDVIGIKPKRKVGLGGANMQTVSELGTAAPAASGPSSVAFSSRPATGRRPMTSKYEPPTTPARTTRGSPRPTSVKSIVEKSPNADSVLIRARKSRSSGTENFAFSAPMPRALWRM